MAADAGGLLPLRPWRAASKRGSVMRKRAVEDDRSIPPPSPDPKLRYRRIVLKLSGEALCGGPGGFGIDAETMRSVAAELADVHSLGVQIGIVVGGGNIFRGLKGASAGMDRAQSDYMGMLATVMNALALQDALEKADVPTRVQTAIEIRQVAEPYIRRRAVRHLERGRMVIFAAGTGNPYFSTDTAAALRAMEIHADCLCKATKVEGIYDRDPVHFPQASMYPKMTFDRFLADRIGVMDTTAVTLCRDNKLPIRVFKLMTRGNIKRVVFGEQLGTIVEDQLRGLTLRGFEGRANEMADVGDVGFVELADQDLGFHHPELEPRTHFVEELARSIIEAHDHLGPRKDERPRRRIGWHERKSKELDRDTVGKAQRRHFVRGRYAGRGMCRRQSLFETESGK